MAKQNNPNFKEVVEGTLKRLADKKVLTNESSQEIGTMLTLSTAPQYHQQDDFTVVLLRNSDTKEVLSLGVSKRNPTDPKVLLRGRALALSRAVKSFVDKVLNEQPKDRAFTPTTSA